MQQYRKNLGKVSLTSEGAWSREKSYEILSIVYDEHTQRGFISRQNVPQGIDLYNKEYWMPFNVSGYADNNMIILADKVNEHSIKSYTLEEAILSIAQVGRRPGAILGFYNENADRLDIGGRWELWQFNDTNIYNWENTNCWNSIYYNYNKFVGWFNREEMLVKHNPFPEIGCYAYVGNELELATVYRCDKKHEWYNSEQPAWDYIKVLIAGTVSVGPNGNWFNDGVDTGIPAVGPAGKTPKFRINEGYIEISYNGIDWDKLLSLIEITPTISIGDVNTLPSGSKATVINEGTSTNAKFSFNIPMGNTGPKGDKGDAWSVAGFVDNVSQLPTSASLGETYVVGTTEPYYKYVWNGQSWINIGNVYEIKASIFDGGRADTLYGGAREINCGGADAFLT